MAVCEDCDNTVVWLRRSDGSWAPPVEPTLDFANGEFVTANGEGVIVALPQIYKRHRCLTAEELNARREAKAEEKRRLIEIDRARRAEAARVQAETEAALAEQRRQQEEHEREIREALAKERSRERALRSFKPRRLLAVKCRDCGVEEEEPCLNLTANAGRWGSWHITTPHNSRFEDGPPARKVRQAERWGEDYEGPWPPRENDPGRYAMRNWLAENFTIFDVDGYQERDWLTTTEEFALGRWLGRHASIFEEVQDAPPAAQPSPYDPADVL